MIHLPDAPATGGGRLRRLHRLGDGAGVSNAAVITVCDGIGVFGFSVITVWDGDDGGVSGVTVCTDW
jgi:hypothetical protein